MCACVLGWVYNRGWGVSFSFVYQCHVILFLPFSVQHFGCIFNLLKSAVEIKFDLLMVMITTRDHDTNDDNDSSKMMLMMTVLKAMTFMTVVTELDAALRLKAKYCFRGSSAAA